MQAHNEIGGKTLQGREVREWYTGQVTTANGRPCILLRFHGRTTARALVRWLDTGKTQWMGRYEIAPEIS